MADFTHQAIPVKPPMTEHIRLDELGSEPLHPAIYSWLHSFASRLSFTYWALSTNRD